MVNEERDMLTGSDVYQPPGTVPWKAFDESHPDHAEFVERADRCFADHDHDQWLASRHIITCWCVACDDVVTEALIDNGDQDMLWQRIFITCPDCGNKRCPKASHHDLACTGSNEPGQPGSVYQ